MTCQYNGHADLQVDIMNPLTRPFTQNLFIVQIKTIGSARVNSTQTCPFLTIIFELTMNKRRGYILDHQVDQVHLFTLAQIQSFFTLIGENKFLTHRQQTILVQ